MKKNKLSYIKNYLVTGEEGLKSRRYDIDAPDDAIYMTIADTDFAVPQFAIDRVVGVVKKGSLPYIYYTDKISESLTAWMKKKHSIDINPEFILTSTSVLGMMQTYMKTFTKEGDSIILQTPVFNAFEESIKLTGRKVLENSLIFEKNKFKIDFKDLEEKMQVANMMILCNPHNPTGTVYTKEELTKVFDLAMKHDVFMIIDEVWQDIIHPGKTFVSSLFDHPWHKRVSVSSFSKSFNIGSSGYAYSIFISDKDKIYSTALAAMKSNVNIMTHCPWTMELILSLYNNPEALVWLKEYNEYLASNVKMISTLLDEYSIPYSRGDSAYVVFADLGTMSDNKTLVVDELKKHNVFVTNGIIYGKKYETWARINAGVSSEDVKVFISKLSDILKNK